MNICFIAYPYDKLDALKLVAFANFFISLTSFIKSNFL